MTASKHQETTITIKEIVRLEELSSSWNKLADSAHIDSVFLRYEWFDAAWQWTKQESELFILAAYANETMIGICPLIKRNIKYHGIKIRQLEFLSTPDAQLCDIIAPQNRIEFVVRAIARHLRSTNNHWDVIQLNNLIATSPTVQIFTSAMAEQGLSTAVQSQSNNPSITLNSDWQTYYSRRSRTLKKGNNHVKNRLSRAYEDIELVWLYGNPLDKDKFNSTLNNIIHISSQSWKNNTGLTLDNSGPNAFIKRLSQHANDNGWLSVWLLFLNKQAVALEYQLIYKGKIHALRSDYIQSFDNVSPGTYLNWKMLEQLFDTDLDYYEMGPGNNPYKYRWAENETLMSQLIVYNKSLAGTLLTLLQFKVKPLLQKLRRKHSQ
jgi:CelD/BcsL family acetyltransferase involved in cellulose biosynthesis